METQQTQQKRDPQAVVSLGLLGVPAGSGFESCKVFLGLSAFLGGENPEIAGPKTDLNILLIFCGSYDSDSRLHEDCVGVPDLGI